MSFVPDQPDDNRNGANPSDPAPDSTSKPKWEPTAETFQKLLALLSFDHEEAGKEYEKLRTILIRFFEWRGCGAAEDLADKSFDRVMKKIDEGETITNLKAYARRVAYYIYLEYDEATLMTELDDDLPLPAQDNSESDSDDKDLRFDCFDKCLDELPPESKYLIVEYYQGDKKTKKERRRALAKQLGIPLNALRIRAHRIRKGLEQCIRSCTAPQM